MIVDLEQRLFRHNTSTRIHPNSVHGSSSTRPTLTGQPSRPPCFRLRADEPGDPAAASESRQGESAHAPVRRPHILIVDDDAMLLDTLADLIEIRIAGARVSTCLSGVEALHLAAQTDYDAIISDVKMPHMDGLTLLAKIRAIRPVTPVLMITGHGDHDLKLKALELGAFAFIAKPIDRHAFTASLQQAIVHGSSSGEPRV